MSHSLILPDGRKLSFAEYGAADGRPVLFCHGAPGSRWQVLPGMAEIAENQGLHLIVPERPGYGLSDALPGRTLTDWAGDAAALMDYLGIPQFGVLGYSLGGAYALACASALPERVSGVTLGASMAPNIFTPEVADVMLPLTTQTLTAARDAPEALAQSLGAYAANPGQLLDTIAASLPATDQAVLVNSEVRNGYLRDFEETLRNCEHSIVRDFCARNPRLGIPAGKYRDRRIAMAWAQ